MMNRKEFYDYIKDNVKEYLPPSFENAAVDLEETVKNNDLKPMGVTIRREGEIVAPKLYIDGYFEDYVQGRNVDEIVGEIADLRIENDNPELADIADLLQNYEDVKNRLQTHILDPDRNTEKLQDAMYTVKGDFAITYHIRLGDIEEGVGASVMVTPRMLEQWGVTKEALIQDARDSDINHGVTFISMEDILGEMMFGEEATNIFEYPEEFDAEKMMKDPMFVITNPERQYGAALIANEDVQAEIAELLHSNYFIIPSSLHECIVVPEGMGVSVEELNQMVVEVNSTQVEPEDLLCDNVQHYDMKSGVMERATLWEEKEIAKQAAEMGEVKEGVSVGKSILERLEAKKEESLQTITDVATMGKAKATENAL